MPRLHLTVHGRKFANQGSKQGGLPRPIWPNQTNTIPTQQLQVSHTQQDRWLFLSLCFFAPGPATIADHQFLCRQHYQATIGGLSKFKVHLWEILRSLHAFQAIQQFLPSTRLATPLAGLIAPDKFLGMSNMRLLRLILAQTPLHPLLTQAQVFGIVARILFNAIKG